MTQKDSLISKIKIFLFAVLSNIRINIVGQFPLSELLALTNCLSVPYWKNLLKIKDVRKISIAYVLFFVSQVISDIVNQSSFQNAVRGWANILMAIVVFSFLYNQFYNSKSIVIALLFGQIISMIIFQPSSEGLNFQDMTTFKFRIAPIINNVILIVAYYLLLINKRNVLNVTMLLFSYGLICMVLDFRSNGIFMILTGLILISKNGFRKLKRRKIILIGLLTLLLFQLIYMTYVSEVISGKFGGEHSREQLVRIKNPYNPFNLLQSGRSEFFVALYAIADKPIFGFGSWAPDPGGKYTALQYEMNDEKDKFSGAYQESSALIIPSHSVILGAWMYAGFGAFLCIGYIFVVFIKRSISLLKSPNILYSPLAPIIIFFIINGMWTFFFSPLPHIRQSLPIFLALILVMYKRNTEYIKKQVIRSKAIGNIQQNEDK
jgi:hypothetical protein